MHEKTTSGAVASAAATIEDPKFPQTMQLAMVRELELRQKIPRSQFSAMVHWVNCGEDAKQSNALLPKFPKIAQFTSVGEEWEQ